MLWMSNLCVIRVLFGITFVLLDFSFFAHCTLSDDNDNGLL